MSIRTSVVPKEKFTDPTSGLENVTFSRGTTSDAASFKDTLDDLAHHIRTWNVYEAVNTAKEMKDMADPVFTQPVRPQRKYYKSRTDHHISDQETMVETSYRFTIG